MLRVRGRYRDQKLELDQPLNLKEGAEVEIDVHVAAEADEEVWCDASMSRLEEEWDNPKDAVYDNWRKLYGV